VKSPREYLKTEREENKSKQTNKTHMTGKESGKG
jgi:hypothetical protein